MSVIEIETNQFNEEILNTVIVDYYVTKNLIIYTMSI